MIRLAMIFLVSFFYVMSNAASASLLEGQTVVYVYYFPDGGNPIFSDFNITVGPGEELANLFGDPNAGRGTVDISDKNITIDFFANATLNPASFNGFRIVDLYSTVGAFTSVAINPATNLPGFTASDITFDADNIYVNLENLTFTTESLISIDINGGNAPVPEPATLVVWSGLGFAAAFSLYTKKRKRT